MKLFKLIKSMDYVTYPIYKELVQISDAIGNSITAFRDMLISTIIGVIFEVTPISNLVVDYLKEKYPDPESFINKFVSYADITVFISILFALIVFFLINLVQFFISRWGSNKNTKRKRDVIVYEFYNVAIPQLIEVKSILEQMNDDDSGEDRKKLLLLLQAKHGVCDLYSLLFGMHIVERDKSGVQTTNSRILNSRISMFAYTTFLEELLEILFSIYSELTNNYTDSAKEDIDDICATINSSGVFNQVPQLDTRLREIQRQITQSSNPSAT